MHLESADKPLVAADTRCKESLQAEGNEDAVANEIEASSMELASARSRKSEMNETTALGGKNAQTHDNIPACRDVVVRGGSSGDEAAVGSTSPSLSLTLSEDSPPPASSPSPLVQAMHFNDAGDGVGSGPEQDYVRSRGQVSQTTRGHVKAENEIQGCIEPGHASSKSQSKKQPMEHKDGDESSVTVRRFVSTPTGSNVLGDVRKRRPRDSEGRRNTAKDARRVRDQAVHSMGEVEKAGNEEEEEVVVAVDGGSDVDEVWGHSQAENVQMERRAQNSARSGQVLGTGAAMRNRECFSEGEKEEWIASEKALERASNIPIYSTIRSNLQPRPDKRVKSARKEPRTRDEIHESSTRRGQSSAAVKECASRRPRNKASQKDRDSSRAGGGRGCGGNSGSDESSDFEEAGGVGGFAPLDLLMSCPPSRNHAQDSVSEGRASDSTSVRGEDDSLEDECEDLHYRSVPYDLLITPRPMSCKAISPDEVDEVMIATKRGKILTERNEPEHSKTKPRRASDKDIRSELRVSACAGKESRYPGLACLEGGKASMPRGCILLPDPDFV